MDSGGLNWSHSARQARLVSAILGIREASGRRGRRFKSCHPDRVSAGQMPLPELVRASLAACTAAKYRQYRNKSEHLNLLIKWVLPAGPALRSDEEPTG